MFRTNAAPLLWTPGRGRALSADLLLGFGGLGLGNPTTLWTGYDQSAGLAPFVTRYGAAWTKVESGGATLSYSAAGWGVGSRPVVQWNAATNLTQCGLRCDTMAPGVNSLAFDYTYSCPIVWPAAFVAPSAVFAATDDTANNRIAPARLQSATQAAGVARFAGAAITPPDGTLALGLTTTAVRRAIYAQTSAIRGGNRVWQTKIRTAGGTLSFTSGTVGAGTGSALTNFTQGYSIEPPSYRAALSAFGGACCWKGVSATDAQLTLILDNWATYYPLS